MVQKRDNIEFDIVGVLLKQSTHVRGIAKKLRKPHATVARKLIVLKKENVVDYILEGKNKVFFLKKNIFAHNYVLQTESYKLMKLFRRYPELSVLFEDILKKTDEKLIILFGSYAKGLAKKNSDIDIYINTDKRNIKKIIEGIHSKITVKIGYFDLNSPLIKEIIKNHVIIRGVEEFYNALVL